MKTRLTDLLGIEHPVMCAGMGGVSYHRLVAAVSAAGGFGCLGASTMASDEMVEEIRGVRALTDTPFGVDLLTALPDRLMDDVEALIREGASVFVAGLGVPRDAIALCHERNVLVASMCGKVRHAVAGRVPVVAAGGIVDGRGLAAALVLGADGVWVGTRFIATPEARGAPGYKDALLRTAEDGTVITRSYSGKPMRAIRNQWTQHHDEHPEEVQPFPQQLLASMQAGAFHLGADETTPGIDPDREGFPAGQGVGAIDDLVPAADLVRRFVAEAEAALTEAARAQTGV